MEKAKDIIDLVGEDAVKAAFGVSKRRVNQAVASNKLPASWFDALERMTGQTLPRELFTFKGAA